MEKQVDLSIVHNRNMQILSGMSVDEVYNDYMSKISNIDNLNNETEIKKAIYLIDNFKYFLSKRYFDSKHMPESTRILYNLKLNAIHSKLIDNLFNLRVEQVDNYQKIKRK